MEKQELAAGDNIPRQDSFRIPFPRLNHLLQQ